MAATLLLRLQGPMQAWGTQSLFSMRDTTREPTRSGVIGLLCCALGLGRKTQLDEFTHLRMGVRADREAILMKDFQTSRGVLNAEGKKLVNVISNRYYLAGAVFLVGLESEDIRFLQHLQTALMSPRWLLFLGRRAFPPSAPVWLRDGISQAPLESALASFPWMIPLPTSTYQKNKLPTKLRIILETTEGTLSRMDVPISFHERSFGRRTIKIDYYPAPDTHYQEVKNGTAVIPE